MKGVRHVQLQLVVQAGLPQIQVMKILLVVVLVRAVGYLA
jgi:hypothetical protein